MDVRPRASRRLCTGAAIQLILGSRAICECDQIELHDSSSYRRKPYRFVLGIDEDNLVVLVHSVLINPVRVQHAQITTTLPNTLLRSAP